MSHNQPRESGRFSTVPKKPRNLARKQAPTVPSRTTSGPRPVASTATPSSGFPLDTRCSDCGQYAATSHACPASPTTVDSDLRPLATHSDEQVRVLVAESRNASADTLAITARDASIAVRAATADNPYTSDDHVRDLALDGDNDVRSIAVSELDRRGINGWDEGQAELRVAVARQANTVHTPDGQSTMWTGAVTVPTNPPVVPPVSPRRDPLHKAAMQRLGKHYQPGYRGAREAAADLSRHLGRDIKVGEFSTVTVDEVNKVEGIVAIERRANTTRDRLLGHYHDTDEGRALADRDLTTIIGRPASTSNMGDLTDSELARVNNALNEYGRHRTA